MHIYYARDIQISIRLYYYIVMHLAIYSGSLLTEEYTYSIVEYSNGRIYVYEKLSLSAHIHFIILLSYWTATMIIAK